jgi:predicted PurR-regulated permease PerM
MPEQAGYFRIVETRGVIYTVLAKLLLYIFMAFGILKVVFGYFTTTPKNYITKTLSNERTIMGKKFRKRYAAIVCISLLLFIYMFVICFSKLVITSDNKANFYNTGMDLKYKNTDIVNNVKEAEQYILQINSAKQTLRNSTLATDQFVLKNNMPSIVESISEYSKKASDLNDNILTNSILVGVSL